MLTPHLGRSLKSGSYATDDAEENDGVHGVAPAHADQRRERPPHALEPGTIHDTCAVARAAAPPSAAFSQDKSRAHRQACPGLLTRAPSGLQGNEEERKRRQERERPAKTHFLCLFSSAIDTPHRREACRRVGQVEWPDGRTRHSRHLEKGDVWHPRQESN